MSSFHLKQQAIFYFAIQRFLDNTNGAEIGRDIYQPSLNLGYYNLALFLTGTRHNCSRFNVQFDVGRGG